MKLILIQLSSLLQAKNDILNQMRNTNSSLEAKTNELKSQLNQKDESILKLTNELERVKNLLSSKTKEAMLAKE
ncbi:hypothetical protein BpHYR1_054153 [Brachionus plicatilis]|uniref:Uncharacterized protein n=1 Tax=Brachionus plicatilis TaxID=10195 RepID=A0A3M7S985_BRAPC|nr:hypothetical protein BpHYR1_054153 [Brachionus plicatilis]